MAKWIEETIGANGIDIFYQRTGGGGPPVVLLHGLTDNGACWTRLVHDLEAEYDLIMPDARGHGRSSVPEHGYGFEDHAADVIALLETLELDRPALVGHSMGAVSAAIVAAQTPALTRAAILEDPVFLSINMEEQEQEQETEQDWPKRHQMALDMSLEDLVADGQANMPTWSPDTFEPWARAKHETSMRAFDLLNTPGVDSANIVARIGVPTLMITGDPERGAIVSPAKAAELQALNPLLRIARIDGVGHCIRYEQPQKYAAIVRSFLDEVYT